MEPCRWGRSDSDLKFFFLDTAVLVSAGRGVTGYASHSGTCSGLGRVISPPSQACPQPTRRRGVASSSVSAVAGFELDPWGIMSGVSNHLTTLAYSSTVKTGLKWFKRRGFVAVSGGFRPAAAVLVIQLKDGSTFGNR